MGYRTKHEWAAARAVALRQEARLLPIERSSNWQGVRRRMRAMATISEEARRFERMAERFKAQGL